jgi:hypothetical protein
VFGQIETERLIGRKPVVAGVRAPVQWQKVRCIEQGKQCDDWPRRRLPARSSNGLARFTLREMRSMT